MRKYIVLAVLAVVLLSACNGVSISDTPVGPIQTETISVPAPDADVATVNLKFGASDSFQLRAGAEGLVEGTVRYNLDQLKPTVTTTGSEVTIEQSGNGLNLSNKLRNEWELRLSKAVPLSLNVDAGAYRGSYDLGGLRLRALNVNQGAAETTYDFGEANPEAMERLSFSSGAASAELKNLANANAAAMSFEVGAGSYTFDFGGALARTTLVDVQAGTTNMTIRVPRGTPARITLRGVVTSAELDGFSGIGDKQYANAAWDEARPHVDITISSAVGKVKLESN
jgi:hypothetical protein